MVTLRGCGRRRHVSKAAMRGRPYWNFNLDDHGNQDVACVVRLLHSTKAAELRASDACSSPLSRYDSGSDHVAGMSDSASDYPSSAASQGATRTSESERGKSSQEPGVQVSPPALADCIALDVDVTLVAHSMGCAASIIYMTTCLHRQQPHGLARAVLLAPAGYHAHRAPFFCRCLGPFIDVVMCRITNAFCLPYGNAQVILGKLVQDVLSLPALRDLFAFVISGLIGGTLEVSSRASSSALLLPLSSARLFLWLSLSLPLARTLTLQFQGHPIGKNPRVARNTMLSGTSSGVFKQFWRNYKAKQVCHARVDPPSTPPSSSPPTAVLRLRPRLPLLKYCSARLTAASKLPSVVR